MRWNMHESPVSEESSTLCLVRIATSISAAIFPDKHDEIYSQTVESIWQVLRSCWILIHAGYLNRLRSNQGLTLKCMKWESWVESKQISMQHFVIRTYSSRGVNEKLYDPLCRVFKEIRDDYPSASLTTNLKVAIKAINDTTSIKSKTEEAVHEV